MESSEMNKLAAEWDGLPMPRRIFAVLAVMFAVALSVVDGVIANIALPTICEGLEISASQSIWIINVYQIAIIVSLLPFSALGDFVGYRKLYIVGLSVFVVMSLGCALSWNFASLLFCRVMQGFGASAVMSINTSMVRLIYPRRMLGRGLGLNSMVVSVASVAGPTIAAAIMAVADWTWLFSVNIPIGLTAIVLGYVYLPNNPVRQDLKHFKWGDAALNALTFGVIFAVVTGFSHKLPWWLLALGCVVAVALSVVYVRSQLRRPLPIIPFDLMRVPIFSLSIATSILTFVAQMSMMVAMPFILQKQYGFTLLEMGAVITAWPTINMVATPVIGFMVERFHAGVLGCVGLTILTTGLLLVALLPDEPTKFDFIWRLAICGFGFGCFQAPNNSIIIASAPIARSGSASGMMASARLAGQIMGAAMVAFLFYIIPVEDSSNVLFVGAVFSSVAMLLAYSRLSLPLPEALRVGGADLREHNTDSVG